MIGWSAINPVLIEVFTEVSLDATLPSHLYSAEWKERPRSMIHTGQQASVLLKVASVIGIGEDETRRAMVSGKLVETQVGQRRFTLQVQVLCVGHTDDVWAMAVTERIRTRIRRPRILDRLLEVDVAVHRVGNAVKASFKDGGRVFSAANIDVIMGTVVNDTDPIPVNWIQHVVVSGHVQDASGAELPSPPNWDEHEIPTIP